MADPVPSAEASPGRSYTLETFTAGDGYRWRYRHYAPRGSPRAHVVCLHGIQSHGGWYEYSCDQLRQEGFTVSFLDRRGAGLNERDRGDAPGFRRLLDDVAEFLSPRQPRTLLIGISWGGKLAVALQRRHPGLVDGLALLCPGFCPRVRPPLGQRLAILWARLVSPRKLFPIPLNHPDLFTATPRWQQFIRDDPSGLRQATARLLLESVRLDGYLRFVPRYVRVPVLLMLAEKDRIIRNPPTRRYVDRFASEDKEVIEYAGAHHTLEFEPEPAVFLGDLKRWLGRIIGGQGLRG
ncbi:MAG TPA: alpha/beta fold hydrolase [Gemmataceae bacterium]|nr:alpha/beta fold hydrolase [Gemmataceae bacterium]